MLFVTDFVLNFFTAYDEKGRLVTDMAKIRKNYLLGWAFVDAFTMFPYQAAGWFDIDNVYEPKDLKFDFLFWGFIIKFFRVVRINSRLEITKPYRILVHFVDIPKLERQYEFLFTYLTPLTRIIKLLLTVLYFSHFIGCFWFFVSKLEGYPSDCWVVGSGLLDSDW